MKKSVTLVLVVAFCLVSSTAVYACGSDYFENLFVKAKAAKITPAQLTALTKIKNEFFRADHAKGKCHADHDKHEVEFVAAAAGILDSKQFTKITGKKKTEVQELRYEVNQLKKELAEIKALLKDLQKK